VIKAMPQGRKRVERLANAFMFEKKGADFISVSMRLVGCMTLYVIGKGIGNVNSKCGVILF
jgi:hypothetical protein